MKKHIKNAINNLNQDTPYQIFDLDISDKQKNMLASVKTFGGKYKDSYNQFDISSCHFKPDNYEAVKANITSSLGALFYNLNTKYNAGNDDALIHEYISYTHELINAFISANKDSNISQSQKQVDVVFAFSNLKEQNSFYYHVDNFSDLSKVYGPRMLYSMVGSSTYYKKNNSLEERNKYSHTEFENITSKAEFAPVDGDYDTADSSTQAAVDFASNNGVTVYPAIHSAPNHNAEEIGNGRGIFSILLTDNIVEKNPCNAYTITRSARFFKKIQEQNKIVHDETQEQNQSVHDGIPGQNDFAHDEL